MMSLYKIRYLLTEHMERVMFTYHNEKLLIHPSVKENDNYNDLINRIKDDSELMPEIEKTIGVRHISRPLFAFWFGYGAFLHL